MAAPTFTELYDSFKAEAQDRRPDLTFDEGDILEMMSYGGAAMADHIVGWAARRIAATYFDGAKGDDLTVLADDHFNIQKFEAQSATGAVTFARASAAAGAGTLLAGFVVATIKDNLGRETQYTTDADVTFGGADLGPHIVNVTCSTVGTVGNVAAGFVTKKVTTAFDPIITVTNALAIAGGTEDETDEELLDRVRGFSSTLRRATLAALEYGAKQVVGVSYATALEGTTGIVSVYVSDSGGGSNAGMISDVGDELENWRAAGILVNVYGGSVYNVTVALTVTARPGVSTAALAANIKAAIVAKINKLKIGETLYHAQIKEAAMAVDPDGIVNVVVTDPALDLAPLATQLIRTDAGSVTVT